MSVPPAGDFLCAQKVTKDAQETKVSWLPFPAGKRGVGDAAP